MNADQKPAVDLNSYERAQLENIRTWKTERPDMLHRVFLPATIPFSFILYHIVPKRVMRGLVDGFDQVAKTLADQDDLLRKAGVADIEELRHKSLRLSDNLSEDVRNWAMGGAIAEGAVTGMGGFFTISIDIPIIITLALRTAYKIGLCYGFDGRTEDDKNFIMGILAASSAGSLHDKLAALVMLKSIETVMFQKMAMAAMEKVAAEGLARGSSTLLAKKLASDISADIVRHKALQLLPGVGAVIGGSVNGWFMNNVCKAAVRSFQKRWLMQKYSVSDI
ncbi:MAG: EcsC family protein [Elusimicrobiota bacterium]|nr:EcsC family protein [Elusimicrobiota bacterium]